MVLDIAGGRLEVADGSGGGGGGRQRWPAGV